MIDQWACFVRSFREKFTRKASRISKLSCNLHSHVGRADRGLHNENIERETSLLKIDKGQNVNNIY